MRDIEKNILKTLEEDIEILKKRNVSINQIKEYLKLYKDFSNDNTEEYKEKLNKLMEGLK